MTVPKEAIEAAGRAFCRVVVDAIHQRANARGGSNSMSGSEYYMYPPAIAGFDEAISAAISTLPIAGEGKEFTAGAKVRVKDTGETGEIIRCPLIVQADEDDGSQAAMGGTKWIGEFEAAQLELLTAPSSPGKDGGQEPVLFVSEQQLPTCVGTYLPTRKHREGNFQMPLYARPQAASTALVERLEVAETALTQIANAFTAHTYSDAMDAVQALKDIAKEALDAKR